MRKFKTASEYINSFPARTKRLLQAMRNTIRSTVPEAQESISYGMVGYTLNGKPLAYFAGYAGHIGFYPIPSGIAKFKKELGQYKSGKGTARFPLDTPLPLALVRKIVRYRKSEVLA